MTAAPSFSPAAQQIFDLFRGLSESEKRNVREGLGTVDDGFDVPQWQLDVLEERERLYQQGLDQPVPLEEAFRSIREKLQARRKAS